MPKIIDEAYDLILNSAKQKLFEEGYSAFSLRPVAMDCGIAVGTIYHYFENKDDLIAAVMLEDWKCAMAQMEIHCQAATTLSDGLLSIYSAIDNFCRIYETIWSQSEDHISVKILNTRRFQLQMRLNQKIRELLQRFDRMEDFDLSLLLVQIILSSVLEKETSAKQFHKLLLRLFPIYADEPQER